MKLSLLIIVFSCLSIAYGQSGKLKKANTYFDKLAYASAVPLYEELLGSSVDSPHLKSKLARSYFYLNEMEKAEVIFAQFIETPAVDLEDIFYYAQALKQNQKYVESDEWMQKVNELASDDLRGISFVTQLNYFDRIKNQDPYFSYNHQKINSPEADFGGYFSPNGECAYFVTGREKRVLVQNIFAWNNNRFLNIYCAGIDSSFQMTRVYKTKGKVNTRFHEGPMCFSPDGKTVFFTRNNISRGKNRRDQNNIQNLMIYRAEIDNNNKWVNETLLPFNSKEFSSGHPTISKDGKTLYFASDRPGGFGGVDLYSVAVFADGSFGEPKNLGSTINTEGNEMFPWINAENELFFSSNGHIGLGGLDVFVALPDKKFEFSKVLNVGQPINSNKDDFAFVMHSNSTNGFFSSNRINGTGNDDIYSFVKIRPFASTHIVEGIISDIESSIPLVGAKVVLKDRNDSIIATATANDQGKYSFELEPDMDYRIEVSMEDYVQKTLDVSTVGITIDTNVLEKNLGLNSVPALSLFALITDHKTGEPLTNVTLTFLDKTTNEKRILTTDDKGTVIMPLLDKQLGDEVKYQLLIEKDGYFTKEVLYTKVITRPGQYDVHDVLDLGLDKLVKDLTEMIEINPINFDLNKYNIRPDAAIELDKIVDIMNQYPNMVVELGSHTDCRGSKAYNENLSDRRAKASAAYIKGRITDPERIYGKGYGETILLNDCECEGNLKSSCSEEEHAKNRRTEFKVIDSAGASLRKNMK
jgi:outer membrane protein OmpA-like peptidoglycan-associated protein/tetratricopeptide (TPR) repeat protein